MWFCIPHLVHAFFSILFFITSWETPFIASSIVLNVFFWSEEDSCYSTSCTVVLVQLLSYYNFSCALPTIIILFIHMSSSWVGSIKDKQHLIAYGRINLSMFFKSGPDRYALLARILNVSTRMSSDLYTNVLICLRACFGRLETLNHFSILFKNCSISHTSFVIHIVFW